MKRNLFTFSAIIAVVLFFSFQSFAQWSPPGVLFPWQAVPAQFGDEDVSPFIATVSDASGTIHLVWSNENQGQTSLVYAFRENGTWNEITTISDENPYAVMPSLLIDQNGTLHCAWVTMDFNFNFIISYSRKFAGQEWETPVVVSGPEFLLNTYPQLVMDDAGNIRLFYTAADFSEDNTFYYLRHSIIDQSNTEVPVPQPVPLTSPENLASHSSVVADAVGMIHCTWYDSEGGVSNISTAVFDGTVWGPTLKLALSGQGATLQEDMPIVLATNSNSETFAIWVSSMIGTGQYSIKANDTWLPKQNINDPHFRNAAGLYDANDVLHLAGSELSQQGGDLYHHSFQNETWEHTLIEAGTSTSTPGFPSLVISNDTLFCFYVRMTQSSGYQLVETYSPLDFETGVEPTDPFNRSLLSVYPNPVNTSSMLNFDSPNSGAVEFNLYNMAGKKMASNSIQIEHPGIQALNWSKLFGNAMPSKGLYLLEVKNGGFKSTVKIMIAE
ncbi:MAG: T9SS type A sorting domain-containing protein [Bacteroidales bacterium]|nr:T9SS type A sorting domain-containing protein [Bacteroidales bacterium]